MNKRFALIALLLAALMLLSGCNLIGHDDELDGAQVVAKVETSQDTTEITKAEWEAYRDYLASYYQQYFSRTSACRCSSRKTISPPTARLLSSN